MSPVKGTSLEDRKKAAAQAKAAMLEKFRALPDENDPAVLARQAERKAIAEAREVRAAERKAAREAAEEERRVREAAEEAARQIALKAEEEARQIALKAEAEAKEIAYQAEVERQAVLEAEKKAARDARYAARKARKKK